MKYTAWLASGGKVEVDISAAGVDLASITEGVQWITDKYGIMLNMAHVAALVSAGAPQMSAEEFRGLAERASRIDIKDVEQAFDHDHEFGDPGEAPAERPRLTGPVGMPERVRDGDGCTWKYIPHRGKYTLYGSPGGTAFTLDEIRRLFAGWTVID